MCLTVLTVWSSLYAVRLPWFTACDPQIVNFTAPSGKIWLPNGHHPYPVRRIASLIGSLIGSYRTFSVIVVYDSPVYHSVSKCVSQSCYVTCDSHGNSKSELTNGSHLKARLMCAKWVHNGRFALTSSLDPNGSNTLADVRTVFIEHCSTIPISGNNSLYPSGCVSVCSCHHVHHRIRHHILAPFKPF